MTQKKTMTKNEAREFLKGKYVTLYTQVEAKQAMDKIVSMGLIFKDDLRHWEAFPNLSESSFREGVYEFYGHLSVIKEIELSLSDLLAIEIVEEPDKQTSASIRAFVKTVKDEFYDMNLGYLDFVADRFIMDNADKIEPDHRALLEEAVKLLEECCPIMHRLTPDVKARSQINKIEQFLKANRP